MQLMLEQREADVLLGVLRNYLPDLRQEVYKTENFEWRQQMKADEVVIKELIERIAAGGSAGEMSGETEETEAQDSTDAEFVFGAVVTTTE